MMLAAGLMAATALPADAQPRRGASACREARDALRDMAAGAAEAQAMREACGRREENLRQAVWELEGAAAHRLARMDPSWPEEALQQELQRRREFIRRQYRTDSRAPIRPESCASQEPLERRLARVREARAILERESRTGGAFDCRVVP